MTDTNARSGAEILAMHVGDDGKLVTRTGVAHICMRPDLIDEWEKACEELAASEAADRGKNRLGQGGVSKETKSLAKRVQDLEAQIEAADVAFHFRRLDKTRHSEICDEHPPRDGNMLDYTVGYNREAVDNAVVHESLIDPVFELCERKGCKHETCGTWQALLKFLGPGEWEEMANVVRDLSGAVTTPPKSQAASRILDRAGSASRRRAAGE
jgi:hypothetical protein